MLVIQGVLISEEIITEYFACDLNACKGACCIEGDYGAPVIKSEMETIRNYTDIISGYLPEESREFLKNSDGFEFYDEAETWGTSCHSDGACVFMTHDEHGIAMCGIEQAWADGKIPFQKPISCHLYPIRVTKNEHTGFEAWNYDRWDICAAACIRGMREQIPLYKFVKNAIIREKGEAFYEELDAAAEFIRSQKQ